jgi:polysaccharide deacetylase family protein (PEP-CTERM system associated)
VNILSFDLEDWYQIACRMMTGELPPARETLFRQMDVLLELLDQHRSRATFFVLGTVAERFPQLIRRISAEGHEIAAHGYAHLCVHQLSRKQFEEDTRRARDILRDTVGVPVLGYRAPLFSINTRSLWALEVLAELGFHYDSSIFPIHHSRYGIPDFATSPARYKLPGCRQIIELPLATFSLAGLRIPVAGGGYFRLLPLWFLRRAVRQSERQRLPMTTYFHPYEFDTSRLDVFEVVPADGWRRRISGYRLNWRNNLGRPGVRCKVAALLKEWRFTSCQEYINGVQFETNRELLSAAC